MEKSMKRRPKAKPVVKNKDLDEHFIQNCYMRKAVDYDSPALDDPDCYGETELNHPRQGSALTAFAEVALKAKLKPFSLGRDAHHD